jgi:hypothetical protein
VAEQLALDQVLRDRAAVEHHERPGRARRVLVQRLGDQLLADAGLAADEHGGVALGQLLQAGEHLAHDDAAPDESGEAQARRERHLDRLAERLEAHPRGADRQHRPGRDIDVVDAQPAHEGAVGGVEIAQPVAALVEADLAVDAGDLRVAQLHVVAAARADADDRRLDVALEPGVGSGHHLDPASAHAHAGRLSVDVGDPGARAKVIDRHRVS